MVKTMKFENYGLEMRRNWRNYCSSYEFILDDGEHQLTLTDAHEAVRIALSGCFFDSITVKETKFGKIESEKVYDLASPESWTELLRKHVVSVYEESTGEPVLLGIAIEGGCPVACLDVIWEYSSRSNLPEKKNLQAAYEVVSNNASGAYLNALNEWAKKELAPFIK